MFGKGNRGIFANYLFWENVPFSGFEETTTLQITASEGTWGKPKLHFFKGCFWMVSWEGEAVFTICDAQKRCSAENTILLCLQQSTTFAEKM